MKKLFTVLFLSLTLITVSFSQNYWERIQSPTTQRLNSIVFTDSLNGWVCSDSGVIFHTSNAGGNWDIQFSNDSLNLVNLFFLDSQRGWASGWSTIYEPYGTFLVSTTNGGLNWNKQRFRVGEKWAYSFYFLDTLKGFAVGYPQLFMRTTDGGTSWNSVNLDSELVAGFPPFTVKFLNNQYGYACGGQMDIVGVVWRTTDGGVNWATVEDSLTSEPLFDMQIFDSLHILVMGGDLDYGATKLVTYDGGNTWQYTLLGFLHYPVDIGFRTTKEGWAPMGALRKFFYTSDSGENWITFNTPDSVNITRISFPDTIHGFGIGDNGDMVKYVYKPSSNISEESPKNISFFLAQNYPNPFNPATTISWKTSYPGWQILKVYNILGEEVAELVNEFRPAGNYNLKFSGKDLPSGIYLYKLQVIPTGIAQQNFVQVRKMILLK